MHKHTVQIFLRFLVIGMLVTFQSQAGGFQINMLSMKATSMGGAFTGFASDASAVFFNPGAMTFREYSQLSLGASFISAKTSYLSPYAGNSNMKNGLKVPLHLYGIGIINENLAVGISVNTPFHLHSEWDDSWTGRYIVQETNLKSLNVQPSVSYKFSETLGVGGGPVIGFGTTQLRKCATYASSQGDIQMDLDGHSTGIGFNLGLFFQPNEDLGLGIDYRSSMKMKVKDGDAEFSNVPSSLVSDFPASASFSTEYTLPSVISAGASYKLTRELVLCLDFNYTTWKSFDYVPYTFKNYSQLDFGSRKNYENSFAIRLGGQYEISKRIDARAGVAFDNSPVPDASVSPENPDNDRFMFSVGGTLRFGEHVSVDVAYMLQNIKEREVNNEQYNFAGNYKSLINIFGCTLNYQF
jgi:long-chain fatty acid transport protein